MTKNKSMCVLILEDELVIALSLARSVQNFGHTVLGPFGTLETAEAAVAQEIPEIAMLDVNLKNETSFDFAKMLRSKGTTVIFVTGGLVGDIPEELADCQIVMKPFSRQEIGAILSL